VPTATRTVKGHQLRAYQHGEIAVVVWEELGMTCLMTGPVPPETLLAMGMLIDSLEKGQHRTRQEFAERFSSFSTPKNQKQFRELFAPEPLQNTGN